MPITAGMGERGERSVSTSDQTRPPPHSKGCGPAAPPQNGENIINNSWTGLSFAGSLHVCRPTRLVIADRSSPGCDGPYKCYHLILFDHHEKLVAVRRSVWHCGRM